MKHSVKDLEADFSGEAGEKISEYLSLIHRYNKKHALISKKMNEKEMLDELVFDSLALKAFKIQNKYEDIVDIGSGAGVPGIILSVFLPAKRFYLVESRRSKGEFIKTAISRLGLKNVELVSADFFSEKFNDGSLFVAKAFGGEEKILKKVLKENRHSGFVCYKTGRFSVEADRIADNVGCNYSVFSYEIRPGLENRALFEFFSDKNSCVY
ncbi:MAG: 16S rRNA (guanine(527)-N(7))-methyltransferase RsmG [Fibrobacterota bacterium]